LAGIVAINTTNVTVSNNIVNLLSHCMRMLQHRGKAYWKIVVAKKAISGEGSLPSDDKISLLARKEKLIGKNAIGYLSKRSPQFHSMHTIHVVLDGFFVDTEKLHLHPLIGAAKDSDSLYKIYHIFTKLLIERRQPERAAEFLDRHLRGNLIFKVDDDIYAFRNSSGFKPLVIASNKSKTLSIVASENSVHTSLKDMKFNDIRAGALIALRKGAVEEVLTNLPREGILMDPFEFIRESHVTSLFNNKSIYEIRKNIGREQADFLGCKMGQQIDTAYAEPDYTRPMTLGFSIKYQNFWKKFEMAEGIIKDRYDDADHMIDFSEQVSKNKLLTTGKSLKFIIQDRVRNKKIASVQGTIQTGSTARETIYYLRKAGVTCVIILVSYVPTADGRQVGLYTQNRELIANKYVGKVSSIDELNESVNREIGANALYYNSPEILARGIGVPENNLWFPEWVRFLDYNK
jgi:amidophosphoribosyltransferase